MQALRARPYRAQERQIPSMRYLSCCDYSGGWTKGGSRVNFELETPTKRCERPLIVRCGAFGDMVLITALIDELKRRFGRDVDVLTSGPWSEPLLRGQPGVADIVSVRSRKTPFWLSRDQQRAVGRLRARGVGARVAPFFTSASARSGVRFQTVTA